MKLSAVDRPPALEKRRHRRRRVWLSAVIIASEREFPIHIRDISCKGAMIETDLEIAPGARLILFRKGIETAVTVAWARAPLAGLMFEQPFREAELVEYSLPRAPRTQMRRVHRPRRGAEG